VPELTLENAVTGQSVSPRGSEQPSVAISSDAATAHFLSAWHPGAIKHPHDPHTVYPHPHHL
jgi:hypothetical protein